MKKFHSTTLIILSFFLLHFAHAQAPQGMNYQAIARNASGTILMNQPISLRITITNGNAGTNLYQETNTATTNQFGLFTLNIGSGTATINSFASINWSTVTPWLSVELDPLGGTNYIFMGSSQLLSVPYALFAASGNQGPAGQDGDRYTTTSTTTLAVGTGTKTLIVEAGLSYSIGQTIIVANSVNDQMTGTIVSYDASTGGITVNITSFSGSGTYSSWDVSLNGAPGPAGPPGIVPNGSAAGNTTFWNGTSWVVNNNNIYNNGGNVGINTNSPSAKLHIRGSADITQLMLDANSSQSNAQPLISLRSSSGTELMHIHSDNPGNTFVGLSAGKFNSGLFNTFVGSLAGGSNTLGSDNTAVGRNALFSNQSGNDNTATGYKALFTNNTGSNNTAIGSFALTANTIGSDNAAFGVSSLANNVYGYSNTAMGSNSLSANTGGNFNTAFGFQALSNTDLGSENTALGSDALLLNTSGYNNTASGRTALKSNSSGYNNTAFGYAALFKNTSGRYNTATGVNALYSTTSGRSNTASGSNALYTNLVGFDNTAVGDSSLYFNDTGFQNTALGKGSLLSNTNGFSNTATGNYALKSNTTGYLNVATGDSALFLNTSGDFNTGIGFLTNVTAGNLNNATALGARALVDASDKVRIGDANVTVIEGQVNYSIPSDGRFKYNVSESDVKGLAFIKLLRPVEYNFNTKKFQEFLTKDMNEEARRRYLENDFDASSSIRQSGFIAQDVETAMKACGYNFNGLHTPEGANDHYSVSYGLFVVPLVKAVQEQQNQMEDLKKQNEKLHAENETMKKDLLMIKKQLGLDSK